MHKPGDLIEFDGRLAAVIAVAGQSLASTDGLQIVPEDHVALWFGDAAAKRSSRGGTGGHVPELWTVPAGYCRPAPKPIVRH
jgi:hypothetical protein